MANLIRTERTRFWLTSSKESARLHLKRKRVVWKIAVACRSSPLIISRDWYRSSPQLGLINQTRSNRSTWHFERMELASDEHADSFSPSRVTYDSPWLESPAHDIGSNQNSNRNEAHMALVNPSPLTSQIVWLREEALHWVYAWPRPGCSASNRVHWIMICRSTRSPAWFGRMPSPPDPSSDRRGVCLGLRHLPQCPHLLIGKQPPCYKFIINDTGKEK